MARTYKPIPNLAVKLRYGIALSYLFYAALIGLMIYWNLTRSSGVSLTILVVQTAPLLLLLPSLLMKYYRAYSWLCFTLLIYFIFAVERSLVSTAEPKDYLFLTLVVVLFISAMLTSRWQQRSQKQSLLTAIERAATEPTTTEKATTTDENSL
ncbi:MAG: elongation factor Tu [Alteromonadaceae bacterium]|nr:MAG: elongation factor Tu [Alteromonadaceae bacterium]